MQVGFYSGFEATLRNDIVFSLFLPLCHFLFSFLAFLAFSIFWDDVKLGIYCLDNV